MGNLVINGVIWYVIMFWQLYMVIATLDACFKLNSTTKNKITFAADMALFSTLLKLFIPNSFAIVSPIIMFLDLFFEFRLLYKKSNIKCGLLALSVYLLSIPIELIVGIMAMYLKIQTNTSDVISSIPILIFMNSWFSIVALIATIIFKKRLPSIDITLSENKYLYINLATIVLFIVPNVIFYALNEYDYPIYLLIYNILANIVLVVLSIYNTYGSVQLEVKKVELKNSEMHNKNLNSLVDTVRIFKHDYNNVVHAIGGYIALNDMNGLKKYYDGLVKDSQKVNRLESISPSKINEPSVFGIISSKYQMADLKGISFNFESMFDYQKLRMPIYDFCKILGILLDNAIEAAEETDNPKVGIQIRESVRENIQIISIENTYKDKNIDINKIFDKDFSTKKRSSGLGLWEVKSIVNKNKNVTLITDKDDTYFTQKLIIQK